VYPFSYHQQYFEREIRPHISGSSCASVRFVDTPTWAHKVELLRRAQALVLSSTTEETSSLVAMEAMACGTPVVAFRRGALPEVVVDRVTGYVVDTVQEMAESLTRANAISPRACRARVETYFTAERMQREYRALYQQVLSHAKSRLAS
jgi:glycosyltransferase involved in cell wall biosynthesis